MEEMKTLKISKASNVITMAGCSKRLESQCGIAYRQS